MPPTENSSSPDHHEGDLEEGANPARSNATPNVGNAGDENSTELHAETNAEVVVNIQEIVRGADGRENNVVVRGNGTPVRHVCCCRNDQCFSPYKLTQLALAFFAQLAAVFVGNVINKSPPPCSCSSDSHSHSSDHYKIPVTVAGISLVGFVVTLISMSTTRMRASISSPTAKFSVAVVASVVIISVGMTLPLDAKGKIAVTVAASVPALAAIACA